MDLLKDSLIKKEKELRARTKPDRRINIKWEKAQEFCEYCGFGNDKGLIVFVLKLCKIYGEAKVYNLKSWIKDASYEKDRLCGLLVWKLKQTLLVDKQVN